MATFKSLLDVEVQAAAFEAYQKLFDAYSEKLRKQPDIWKQIQGEHAKVARGFVSLGNATEKHLERLEKIRDVLESERALGEDQQKLSMATASAWKETAGHSDTFARNLGRAALTASKWGALMFGTAAFGAAFGIDRLAASVSGERRQSLATGSSIGQLKAFYTDFARLGDTGLLPAVNTMEADITQRRPWYALGLGQMTGNATQDAIRFANAVRDFAKRTPIALLGPLARAYGLPESDATLLTYRRTGNPEWQKLMAQAATDAKGMSVPPQAALAWQNLSTQLSRNLATVTSTFETQLARGAPLLSKFSDAVSASTASWITYFGNGIANEYKIAQKDPWQALLYGLKGAGNLFYNLVGVGEPMFGKGSAAEQYGKGFRKIENSPFWKAFNNLRNSFFNQKLAGLDTQFGLPAGLLEITRALESGTHFSPAASSKGALGVFQFMPGVAKRMGFNPLDPDQSAVGAARLYSKLDKEFHGNIPEMLAAYNWNPDSVERLVKKYGDTNWGLHIPRSNTETPEYLRRAARMFKPYAVDITIVNKTGSDVTASISALGSSK